MGWTFDSSSLTAKEKLTIAWRSLAIAPLLPRCKRYMDAPVVDIVEVLNQQPYCAHPSVRLRDFWDPLTIREIWMRSISMGYPWACATIIRHHDMGITMARRVKLGPKDIDLSTEILCAISTMAQIEVKPDFVRPP